jgi:hypothetical protein
MAPPIITKIKSMIPLDIYTTSTNNDKNLTFQKKDFCPLLKPRIKD